MRLLRDVRRVVPQYARSQARAAIQRLRDLGRGVVFAQTQADRAPMTVALRLTQPLYTTQAPAPKIHNINIAAATVSGILIAPGETFSFWQTVGATTARRGYVPSRNLVGGQLRQEYGGGVCQLSGLLYHASLVLGLQITERHAHTIDLYEDDQRFTPLGADAAVVFGYKDLRVRNTLHAGVRFVPTIEDQALVLTAYSAAPITLLETRFIAQQPRPGRRIVETKQRREGQWQCVARSEYALPAAAPQA